MLSESSRSFKQVGLIEYPRRGLWAIVFISTETRGEVLNVVLAFAAEHFERVALLAVRDGQAMASPASDWSGPVAPTTTACAS